MPVLEDTVNSPQAWSGRASAPSSWEAAGWSEEGQRRRFEAVLAHLDLARWDSVLDFGCGTGAFADLLPRETHYYGVDWAEGMIERARSERPFSKDCRRTFILADAPPPGAPYDHVVAIGTFNLPGSEAERFLPNLWERTRKSLIVSLYCGDDPRCLSYEPDMSDFARMSGCREHVVDRVYRDNDFLLVMRR